jgi:hypothetical protein
VAFQSGATVEAAGAEPAAGTQKAYIGWWGSDTPMHLALGIDSATHILNIVTTTSGSSTAGFVGIKTYAPLANLDVVGTTRFGDSTTNYVAISATGNQTFVGSAGFYPRLLNQTAEPAAGTGATELDTSEMCIWTDSDDSKCYLAYNQAGTVKTIELT